MSYHWTNYVLEELREDYILQMKITIQFIILLPVYISELMCWSVQVWHSQRCVWTQSIIFHAEQEETGRSWSWDSVPPIYWTPPVDMYHEILPEKKLTYIDNGSLCTYSPDSRSLHRHTTNLAVPQLMSGWQQRSLRFKSLILLQQRLRSTECLEKCVYTLIN